MTVALVVIGVGYSGSARAEYWPWNMDFNQRFIEAFKIDSVFEFPADEASSGRNENGTGFSTFMKKVKYQTCPNMMSVCFLTFSNATDQYDDYDMEYSKLYLYNKASGEYMRLCDIYIYPDLSPEVWLSGPDYYKTSEVSEGNVNLLRTTMVAKRH